MESPVATSERVQFSDRLKSSLKAAGLSTRASEFVRAYNLRADGAAVTAHAVRKWLNGESIPTQEKIVIVAHWLGVHASWLRFGDAENGAVGTVIPEAALPTTFLTLVQDVMALPEPAQDVIRQMVALLGKAYAAGEGTRNHSVMPHRMQKK